MYFFCFVIDFCQKLYDNNTINYWFWVMIMTYERELSFFRKLLKNFHINSCIIKSGDVSFRMADQGLRDFLGLQENYNQFFCTAHETIKENTLYKITDEFNCTYIFAVLPNIDEQATFIVGPYVESGMTQQQLLAMFKDYNVSSDLLSQIEKYYTSIPSITDKTFILNLFNSLGEMLWDDIDNFTIEELNMNFAEKPFPEVVTSLSEHVDDALLAMKMLETRYDGERRLMQAVSQGVAHKADQIISSSSELVLEMRVPDPVRNMKNYVIITNVLLRKAAEQGGVHPFYIDGVSSSFAKRLEQIKTVEEGIAMQHEMVYAYSTLVKNHSMKKFSLLVQKAITLIDFDLTADLSLSKQAELLNVNASYLSALFKKETGMTLTEFVNKKRIDHAAFLLSSTNLQIQTIAQNCGIYDVNYFTKMFKKLKGKTPKEYRDEANKF